MNLKSNMFGPKRLFVNRRYGFGRPTSHLVIRRQPTQEGETLHASFVDSVTYYNTYVNTMRLMDASAYTEGAQILNPSLAVPHHDMTIDDTYDLSNNVDRCMEILNNVELESSSENE